MIHQSNVATLARVNAEALIDALGARGTGAVREMLVRLAMRRTLPFARSLAMFDERVGRDGLAQGARWLLGQCVGGVDISGREHVPRTGPVLLLANHPGLSDTLALFSAVPRDDLRILAADRPFLRALPHSSARLFYLAERPEQRLGALRGLAAHLRGSGSVLTFPAGAIEPDPALHPDRAQRLLGWAERLEALTRIARDAPIVPAVVSGVLSAAAQRHPLTRIRRRQSDREWLGAMLQMVWRPYQDVIVQVRFGEPILPATGSKTEVAERVRHAARGLISDGRRA